MAEVTSNWWTFHNASWCPGSSSTLYLLPSVLIKRSACLWLRGWDTTPLAPLFFCRVAPEFPCPNPLRAECWESRPPEPPSALWHLLGCAGDQVFGEHLCDCSLPPDYCRRRLLSRIIYFSVDIQGTALGTSSCIDCGPLLRATHNVDSCEWSHQCLKHASLRWVYF
jgi:hypothetical protein